MLTLLITALSFEKRGFIVAQKNGFVKPFFQKYLFFVRLGRKSVVWSETHW